jgi:hypothetical protein
MKPNRTSILQSQYKTDEILINGEMLFVYYFPSYPKENVILEHTAILYLLSHFRSQNNGCIIKQ